jgi:hypothetical protein
MARGRRLCGRDELRSAAFSGWVYAFAVPAPAPRSPVRYVEYDAARRRRARSVAVGFGAATCGISPCAAATAASATGSDRLKVRATARFLGSSRSAADEDDIEWAFGAWHAGPIRVVRREWQWVRLGWGLRTPIFRTESFIYRDFVELPVRLRLNFPPTYFFRGIEVQATLDFRDLDGWTVRAPSGPLAVVGATPEHLRARGDAPDGDWLALEGPDLTLVVRLRLGESLASLRRQIVSREDTGGYGPEDVPGEHPAVGFRLTEWSHVDRGQHGFAALAYALPSGYDLDEFARQDAAPLTVDVRPRDRSSPSRSRAMALREHDR